MHLFLPSARPCYTDGRLVKRSRALLGSNPTRDNRVRAGECSCSALAALTAGALFFFTPIHLPCHASENPIAALRSGENDPQILRKSPKLERLETQYKGDMDEAMKYIGIIAHLRILAVNATKSLTDRGLQYVPKLQSLERLDICNTAVTDAGMKYIAQLPNLKELSMDEDDISDEGFKEIGKLHQLRSLVLSGPRITDKGVETLHELRNLRFICLAKTHITDKSMEWIGSLKDIETVFVGETEVTDAGIAHLMGKPHLDFVVLDKTRVTAEGAHKLEESLKANHAEVSHESIIPDD